MFISRIEDWRVKYSKLFAKKVIKGSIYWDGIVKIPNVLNKGLHDAVDVDPVIVV
jgi:hypothetical protein